MGTSKAASVTRKLRHLSSGPGRSQQIGAALPPAAEASVPCAPSDPTARRIGVTAWENRFIEFLITLKTRGNVLSEIVDGRKSFALFSKKSLREQSARHIV